MKKIVVALTVMAITASATFVATNANAIPPVCNPTRMSC